MRIIVEMQFGSHLYGTATARSDLDFKSVHVPAARDILLQRVRDTITSSRPKAPGERNDPDDVDRESYSLQRYLALLAQGQTVALDMLFAPDAALIGVPAPEWRDIQANAGRLVTRRAATAFLRYCRQQANRYGAKGSRIAAARAALAVLAAAEAEHGTTARLSTVAAQLTAFAAATGHVSLPDIETPGGVVRHLDVLGRRMPFTASIKSAREVVERLVDEFGRRARDAERNDGADWKALSHAVRIAREALELLETGRITFPLACAAELVAIKRGERAYAAVAADIDALLEAVESAALRSTLRAAPDLAFVDDVVARAYRAAVLEAQ